jgi:choline dehydrogenase-like flavoprotein
LFSCLKTPQLLELSGIGNRAVLEKAGIPVKLDLMAVGENIQEHYYTNISWGKHILDA